MLAPSDASRHGRASGGRARGPGCSRVRGPGCGGRAAAAGAGPRDNRPSRKASGIGWESQVCVFSSGFLAVVFHKLAILFRGSAKGRFNDVPGLNA